MTPNLARSQAAFAVLTLLAGAAAAQTPPDAGSLLQQQQQRKPETQPPQTPPPSLQTLPAARQPGGADERVHVKRFVLSGNTLLGDEVLQAALAAYQDRDLTLAEMRRAAAAVGEVYQQAGWLARAQVPPQDVSEGLIRIQIVEARLGAVRVEGTPSRFDPARAQAMATARSKPGEFLNLADLDRALLLLDDVPGLSATGALSAGQAESQTDVVLKLADTPLLSASVGADNGGSRSTGAARLNGDVSLNSPFGHGERLGASLSAAEGTHYARLAGSVPLGLDGWRAELNASGMRYHLVGADFEALQSKGSSSTYGMAFTYPLLRSRGRNLNLALAAEHKHFDNEANGATSSRYSSHALSLSLDGYSQDTLGGGGYSAGSVAFNTGRLNLAGSPNEAGDAATANTQGSFTKLRYSFSRQQTLSPMFSASLAVAGQYSGRNLDSSEKFYLGGASGVRAYPASEAGGSSGLLVNAELRASLPQGFSLGAFVDAGHVTVNPDSGFAGAPSPNSITLKGAGLSLAWQGPKRLALQATWARRIGHNPNPGPNGMDQDGTLKRNRLWLQASLPF